MRKFMACIILGVLFIGLSGFQGHAQQTYYQQPPDDSISAYSPYPVARHDPPGELILADVLILRPLGIAASIVGLAGSVISAPFAATSNSFGVVNEKLIREPFDYTWCRPLGQMEPK
jgi:hypothetical protein